MSVLHLQFVRPDGEQENFHLKAVRRYHLGRGSMCELRILDMKMSRQHCAFEEQDGQWRVLDLGSTNGINVDGQRVQEAHDLSGNETISAGNSEISVLAISDHLDLAPEELMTLGEQAPLEQESMPSVTEEVPIPANDNPWEGEPQGAIDRHGDDALTNPEREHKATEVIAKKPAAAPTPSADHQSAPVDQTPAPASEPPADEVPLPAAKARGRPIRTPLPEPANALPHQDGDALESRQGQPAPTRPQTEPVTRQPRSTSGGDMVVTLLGRRIGPIPRDTARELKKKQIMGTLTEAELGQYPSA